MHSIINEILFLKKITQRKDQTHHPKTLGNETDQFYRTHAQEITTKK